MTEETPKEVEEETTKVVPETTPEEPSNPAEEPEKQPLYAGKYKTPEDLEQAYKEANASNTKMAQELAESRKPALAPDKQEIADEIKGLGFVTQAEFKQQQAVGNQKAKDDLEISQLELTDAQANTLRRFSSHKDNLSKSMTELWDELQGSIGGKVVSRKTTLKPKTGTRDTFKPLGQVEIAKLSEEDYKKYWVDYASYKANQ